MEQMCYLDCLLRIKKVFLIVLSFCNIRNTRGVLSIAFVNCIGIQNPYILERG